MAVWMLTPVDLDDPNWEASSHRGPAIVRAPDEQKARETAERAFDVKPGFRPGQGVRVPPWSRAALVRAVRGAAFKPDTDEGRESPALDVAAEIQGMGALVRVHDPRASEKARALAPDLDYAPTPEKACAAADLVLHLTEWRQYRDLDPAALGSIVRRRRLVDGRNALPARRWQEAGWTVRGLGLGRAAS